VTRVLSGAVLVLLAVAIVWFSPALVFRAAAFALLFLSVREFVGLAHRGGLPVSLWLTVTGSLITLAAFAWAAPRADALAAVLLVQAVAIPAAAMAAWNGGRDAMATVSASLFPSVYLALPIGALVAVRELEGPAALFLLMLTVMVSDTAQYYTGRLFGRTPLAPAISPKKTVEGAVAGILATAVFMPVAGRYVLPGAELGPLVALGLLVAGAGIAGDLFESLLKRSSGIKDSSALIPGHGGVLDRIDALLFAAPVFYFYLRNI
jgi:phosphatidate cytidylyltransferase